MPYKDPAKRRESNRAYRQRNSAKTQACRRAYYERNRDRFKADAARYTKAHRTALAVAAEQRIRAIRQWWHAYRTTLACVDCGESHPATLDFHHRDPATKEAGVSRMVHQGMAKDRILAEIAKCDVLCANCHRKRHWNEQRVADAA